MTDAILLAPQPLHCGRGKFVAGPVLSSLFDGAALRRLKADDALFVAGDPVDGCYRLEQGLLKVVVTSPRGDERILAMLGPGAIVGELAMLDREPRSASVFAVRDCELSFISRAAFEERTVRHPEIYQYLINVLANRLRATDEAMAAASFLTVQARLARAPQARRACRPRRRRGSCRDPPQDQPKRPRGDGWGGARKREPGDERLEAGPGGDAFVGLIPS